MSSCYSVGYIHYIESNLKNIFKTFVVDNHSSSNQTINPASTDYSQVYLFDPVRIYEWAVFKFTYNQYIPSLTVIAGLIIVYFAIKKSKSKLLYFTSISILIFSLIPVEYIFRPPTTSFKPETIEFNNSIQQSEIGNSEIIFARYKVPTNYTSCKTITIYLDGHVERSD